MNIRKYKKIITAVCLAAFTFIGTQNHSAEAMTNHQVVEGDTLWALSQQFGLSIDVIKLANDRQKDLIYIGEILQIPDSEEEIPVTAEEPETEEASAVPAVAISKDERELLERIVEAEAKGESFAGKVAVATVILNRVDSPEFPNNVRDVVYEVVGKAYAFTPVQNGEINKPASEESKRAVEEALKRTDRLNEAVYFYNPQIATDNWIRTRQVVAAIGNHVFAI